MRGGVYGRERRQARSSVTGYLFILSGLWQVWLEKRIRELKICAAANRGAFNAPSYLPSLASSFVFPIISKGGIYHATFSRKKNIGSYKFCNVHLFHWFAPLPFRRNTRYLSHRCSNCSQLPLKRG